MVLLGAIACNPSPTSGGCRGALVRNAPRGTLAPDFTLSPLEEDTRPITLSRVAERRPVLLVFWATWCPSCNEEIPILNQWQERFRPQGLEILAINVQESREQIVRFAQKKKIRYPILLDSTGEVSQRYGLAGLPAAVFLLPGRKIVYFSFSLPQNIEELMRRAVSTVR